MVIQSQRKGTFCITAATRPLCVPWTTKTAVVSQQVGQRRQSGGRTIVMVAQWLPWSPNGGAVVATVIAQWKLLVGQMRHSGGTGEAEASLKFIQNAYNSATYYTGRPKADLCASFLRPWRCVCFPPLSFERPVSDPSLGVLCATGLNMLKTSLRPWRPWVGLNVLCATRERPR